MVYVVVLVLKNPVAYLTIFVKIAKKLKLNYTLRNSGVLFSPFIKSTLISLYSTSRALQVIYNIRQGAEGPIP